MKNRSIKNIKKKLFHTFHKPKRNATNQPSQLNIPLMILLICSIGLVISIFLIRQTQDPRKEASPEEKSDSGTSLLVSEFAYDKQNDILSLTKATIIDSDEEVSKEPGSTVYIGQDKTILNTDQFQNLGEIIPENFDALLGKASIGKHEASTSATKVISIPYTENTSLSIIDRSTSNTYRFDATSINNAIQETKTSQEPMPPPNNQNRELDILFISSDYQSESKFQEYVEQMKDFLLSLEPFNKFQKHINIHSLFTQEDLGCHRDANMTRLLVCDFYKINTIAASKTYDTIVVIDNTQNYGGSGQLGLAVTYGNLDELAKEVMVHEFGHSFAGLADEYDKNQEYLSDLPPIWPNCDLASCNKWQNTPTTGCFQTCSYSNLYRPTYNDSLMRTLTPNNGFKFGPVSQKAITEKILEYIGFDHDQDQDADLDYLDYQGLINDFESEPCSSNCTTHTIYSLNKFFSELNQQTLDVLQNKK